MNWTKTELKTALGYETDAELRAFFDASSSVVSQWGDATVPVARQWQAKALRPDLFARWPVIETTKRKH
jgi:hypothetical protein